MAPIVDGLETQYNTDITFMRLNARDNGPGQQVFDMAALPGHPGLLIVKPDGTELWRHVGPATADSIENALLDAVDP